MRRIWGLLESAGTPEAWKLAAAGHKAIETRS